jgi:Short C-terminal domain
MGLVGGIARTAVAAGTWSAVQGRVQRHQQEKWAEEDQQRYAQQGRTAAQATDDQQQHDLEMIKAQLALLQAQQAQAAISAQQTAPVGQPQPVGSTDLPAQLQRLSQMRDAGILTESEFAAAKAKLLGA